MKKIRLKDEYYWCDGDEYIEIDDEVFAVIHESMQIVNKYIELYFVPQSLREILFTIELKMGGANCEI